MIEVNGLVFAYPGAKELLLPSGGVVGMNGRLPPFLVGLLLFPLGCGGTEPGPACWPSTSTPRSRVTGRSLPRPTSGRFAVSSKP